MAYKNRVTKLLSRAMLLFRKLYGVRSKFDKIAMKPNNISKTQMLSHVGHYFEGSFCPGMKRGHMCDADV